MREPLATMPRFNPKAGTAGDSAEGDGVSWSEPADLLLLQAPARLDGIEVVGVRREIDHADTASGAKRYDAFVVVIRNVGTCSFTPDALRNCTSTCDGIPVSRTQAGAVVGSYQYRRYQTGSSPLWTPLRFPGQYYDAETDLAESWNRYYDPSVGRYLQPERMLQEPSYVKQAAKDVQSVPAYSYTFNNPIAYTDPDGLQTCPPGSSCEGCTFNGECWVCPAGKSPRGGMPLCVEGGQPYKPPDPETLKPQVQCEPDNPIGKKLQNPSGGPVGACIAMCRKLSRGNLFKFAACVVAVCVPVAFRH